MRTAETHWATSGALDLRVGEVVEVLSEQEILSTLDDRGELESLPFMPEMIKYCGRRMTVYKVAHKLCDTIERTGMRRMERAVHLTGSRCDGSAHDWCQNACLLYWKEAWLKRVEPSAEQSRSAEHARVAGERLLPLVDLNTRGPAHPDGAERYVCQATELNRASPTCLPLMSFGQYRQDVRSGNASIAEVVRAFAVGLFNRLQGVSTKVLPRRFWFRDGLRWRFLRGEATGRTPTGELGLEPGELVRIKSREQIMATLNGQLLNRGLGFEEEMEYWCGTKARVERRVEQVIDEKTGRMMTMKTPCVVLESVICRGRFTANCPRAWIPFWREIWLERVEPAKPSVV